MTGNSQNPDLAEAASTFLAGLSAEERGASQKEVYSFIRWFGRERGIAGLTAAEVGNYAEHLSLSDTDYMRKLELLRGFLLYVKKQGWSKTNAIEEMTKGGFGFYSGWQNLVNYILKLDIDDIKRQVGVEE